MPWPLPLLLALALPLPWLVPWLVPPRLPPPGFALDGGAAVGVGLGTAVPFSWLPLSALPVLPWLSLPVPFARLWSPPCPGVVRLCGTPWLLSPDEPPAASSTVWRGTAYNAVESAPPAGALPAAAAREPLLREPGRSAASVHPDVVNMTFPATTGAARTTGPTAEPTNAAGQAIAKTLPPVAPVVRGAGPVPPIAVPSVHAIVPEVTTGPPSVRTECSTTAAYPGPAVLPVGDSLAMRIEAPDCLACARACSSATGVHFLAGRVTDWRGRDWPEAASAIVTVTPTATVPRHSRRCLAFLLRCLRRNEVRTSPRAGLGPARAAVRSSRSIILIPGLAGRRGGTLKRLGLR